MIVQITLKIGKIIQIKKINEKITKEALKENISNVLNNDGKHLFFDKLVWDKTLYILKDSISYIEVFDVEKE